MYRITNADLKNDVDLINETTGSPLKPWTRDDNGRNKANIGNYHISGAYGGVCLHQIVNESGGVRDVFSCGHIPKRELHNQMRAFLRGLEIN